MGTPFLKNSEPPDFQSPFRPTETASRFRGTKKTARGKNTRMIPQSAPVPRILPAISEGPIEVSPCRFFFRACSASIKKSPNVFLFGMLIQMTCKILSLSFACNIFPHAGEG